MKKTVQHILTPPAPHWVGDGFPVRTLFSYHEHSTRISPFLLLDHAGPLDFEPGTQRRGVGPHPHRGFETVTVVYDGEVSHRDSSGSGGTIGPGEVQWMTAASGVLHDEYHSDAFGKNGGTLQMVQLWVNLPARHKMDPPRYQALTRDNIPQIPLPDDAGFVRIIAGHHAGHVGAAQTYTPINLWDIELTANASAALELPEGHTLMLLVIHGSVQIQGESAHEGQLVQFSRQGSLLSLTTQTGAQVLVLGGQPIAEPVAGHGPFVMNTRQELLQAFQDFSEGKFGTLEEQQHRN